MVRLRVPSLQWSSPEPHDLHALVLDAKAPRMGNQAGAASIGVGCARRVSRRQPARSVACTA